ncbi:MAG: DUF6580 family putative transport protein [Pirellulales bacterium]
MVESETDRVSGSRSGDDARRLPPVAAVITWMALVSLAVAGRLWQPSWNGEPLWNVTPLAGVALLSGYLFANPLVAASVPLAALAISNLLLPGYGSLGVAAIVYAASAWPALVGSTGLLGRGTPRWAAVLGSSLASSLVFFFSTNLAHWLFVGGYPTTAAGLGECLVAALPFYRWMPVGDAFWAVTLFGVATAAGSIADAVEQRSLRPRGFSSRPLD